MTARTRFAPSPTGSLHVGGARTALYCLLHAHHEGAEFILRIEDTDRARSTEESTRGILRDMRWLGLLWDEGPEADKGRGPYLQSQRLHVYGPHFDELLASGHAYEAWETREELGAMRIAAQKAKQNFRYRRIPYSADDLDRFAAQGRAPVLRLAHPAHDVIVHDKILGDVTLMESELEDIVIRKADGFPTYHFAVVIDDEHMEVGQILRGKEHLMNTPKHLGIYEALGWTVPSVGHLPTILNMSGPKMSKRDKAKTARAAARVEHAKRKADDWSWLAELTGVAADELLRFQKKKSDSIPIAEAIANALHVDLPMIEVMDFRKGGFIPEALNNYLALLGWNPGPHPDTGEEREILSHDEMVQLFTLDRAGKTDARFAPTKLAWMNGEYMRRLPEARLIELLDQWFEVVSSELADLSDARLRQILALYRERAQTFAELESKARYLWSPPTSYHAKGAKKWLLKGNGLQNLIAARQALQACEWTELGAQQALESLATELEVGLGKVAQPIRLAIAGVAATPGLYQTLMMLERDEVIARIDACLANFEEK